MLQCNPSAKLPSRSRDNYQRARTGTSPQTKHIPANTIRPSTRILLAFGIALAMSQAPTTSAAASKPAKPPTLVPGHSYLHITSSHPPQRIVDGSRPPDGLELAYVGPVGELDGEHIFEVKRSGGGVVPRGELPSAVVDALKAVEGVKGAKVLEVKQRAKRDEF